MVPLLLLLRLMLMVGLEMLERRQNLVLGLRLLGAGIRNEKDGSIVGSALKNGPRLNGYLVRSGRGGCLALRGGGLARSGQVFGGAEARQAVSGDI